MIVGFVVNPIAGMGGSVGLKGTDGAQTVAEAVRRGAHKVAPERAVEALRSISSWDLDIGFITSAREMGAQELERAGFSGHVVHCPTEPTSREDTVKAAKAFAEADVELIVFVGGDGTARDVVDAVGQSVPILGVPAGVKMHSSVFLRRPSDLGAVLSRFASTHATAQGEVMDVDEDLFRRGILQARLFALATVPADDARIQATKTVYHTGSADDEAAEIAKYVVDEMREGVVYILGPGSTTAAIAKELGLEKSLLGVDVVLDRRVICADASESDLLRILDERGPAKVVLTPIGAQGFILGRGNQQISPKVLRALGRENMIVVATPTKLAGTPVLRVDTGDPGLDAQLKGKIKVITGYRRRRMVEVE
ncbi:MAG: ATP-NAD kinase family protein [Thermoplasmata archaeon]